MSFVLIRPSVPAPVQNFSLNHPPSSPRVATVPVDPDRQPELRQISHYEAAGSWWPPEPCWLVSWVTGSWKVQLLQRTGATMAEGSRPSCPV
jgi:hypothetical protein